MGILESAQQVPFDAELPLIFFNLGSLVALGCT
jgi:hypothetical protein